jgi:hypothetical protein
MEKRLQSQIGSFTDTLTFPKGLASLCPSIYPNVKIRYLPKKVRDDYIGVVALSGQVVRRINSQREKLSILFCLTQHCCRKTSGSIRVLTHDEEHPLQFLGKDIHEGGSLC